MYLADAYNIDDAPGGGPRQGAAGMILAPDQSLPPGLALEQHQNQLLANLARLAIRASPLGSVTDMVRYHRQAQQAADQGNWGDTWLGAGGSLAAAGGLVPFALGGAAADAARAGIGTTELAQLLGLMRGGQLVKDPSAVALGTRAASGAGKAAMAVAGGPPQGPVQDQGTVGRVPLRRQAPDGLASLLPWSTSTPPPPPADLAKVPSAPTAMDRMVGFIASALQR